MTTATRRPPVALIALLAAITASGASMADTPPAFDGMRYADASVQADDRHDLLAVTTLSLPVGEHAWVQAAGGKARSAEPAAVRRPAILGLAVGAAGAGWQATLGATQRTASRFRQTDWASTLDWRHGGNVLGVDVTHRSSRASGSAEAAGAFGASSTVPVQARIAGSGGGLHGTLAVSDHVSVYAAVARNHYRSSTLQGGTTTAGGPLASNPLLARALLGGTSVVNRDEVALDRNALVGATWRGSRTALSAEVATGQVYDGGGTLRSVAVKAAVDVAPRWRATPGPRPRQRRPGRQGDLRVGGGHLTARDVGAGAAPRSQPR